MLDQKVIWAGTVQACGSAGEDRLLVDSCPKPPPAWLPGHLLDYLATDVMMTVYSLSNTTLEMAHELEKQ